MPAKEKWNRLSSHQVGLLTCRELLGTRFTVGAIGALALALAFNPRLLVSGKTKRAWEAR